MNLHPFACLLVATKGGPAGMHARLGQLTSEVTCLLMHLVAAFLGMYPSALLLARALQLTLGH